MGFNLPPGVTPGMIPGNSDRDMWLEKQMLLIGDELDKLPEWLANAILDKPATDFATIASRCNWLYENNTLDDDGAFLVIVEEARNLAAQADEGHPPEEEER